MAVYNYARVSTNGQDLALQEELPSSFEARPGQHA
jgi:hypothetical protein